MAPSGAVERRMSPRRDQVDLVQVRRLDERGALDVATGRTLNISRGGIRLELCQQLPLRSAVSLSLAVGEKFVTVDGTVVYVEAIDGARCCVGIQFADLDAENGRTLDEFMARSRERTAEALRY